MIKLLTLHISLDKNVSIWLGFEENYDDFKYYVNLFSLKKRCVFLNVLCIIDLRMMEATTILCIYLHVFCENTFD